MIVSSTRVGASTWIADYYPGFEAEVITDSIGPNMKRIITYRAKFNRTILAEVNTHRALSRNSASSRAIPLLKFLDAVTKEPYIPVCLGKNQKGMQPGADLSDSEKKVTEKIWLESRDLMIGQCRKLGLDDVWVDENGQEILSPFDVRGSNFAEGLPGQYCLNIHKEVVNRLLEPFMWHTALITATDWANFFALRTHPKATAAFQIIASLMADAYVQHAPKSLEVGEWHLPYADDPTTKQEVVNHLGKGRNDITIPFTEDEIRPVLLQVSAGRCARVSYLTQDGKRDVIQDIRLHDDLVLRQGDPSLDPAHGSPLEHQAQALMLGDLRHSGNFHGFVQYRKTIKHENIENFIWKGFHIGWSNYNTKEPSVG